MIATAVMALLVAAGVWAAQSRGAAFLAGSGKIVQLSESRLAPPPNVPAPPVEPLRYIDVAPDDAVKINASIPFSTEPNPAARPFKLKSGSDDYARSLDCLAAAAYYEAAAEGDDGMRAVAQVVLNRLRHPAFPKTICGVVFQGSDRDTGCQFTFTCDGSLARIPSVSGWKRAREIAEAALKGKVFKPVGYSTHYHTNWVVPYWSGTLDKVAAVGSHLFFRWQGWWGTPGAFRGDYAGSEPVIAKLASLSPAHAADVQLAGDQTAVPIEKLAERGAKQVKIVSPGGDAFVVVLDKKVGASKFPALALAACGQKDFCKFMGWTDPRKAPKGFPIEAEQHQALSFSYLRNRSNGFEKMLWNCKEFVRADQSQCMKTS
ncbi:putative SleB-like protein [Sphingomonas changbaiensis NBRC 104936]|uniref:Putative SleB-like protein n=1 Tax=Sphingomonas changbaiensis NBRC 104936 TaxID=1219043 RepID=A0A0E9MPT7_9SPHN|nr:cell wall hydrolase [Sphingomonas changbaiensis]GAO39559.1 putative SleB-like protein [Sphingomonas changbaiensis NBRC 104936]